MLPCQSNLIRVKNTLKFSKSLSHTKNKITFTITEVSHDLLSFAQLCVGPIRSSQISRNRFSKPVMHNSNQQLISTAVTRYCAGCNAAYTLFLCLVYLWTQSFPLSGPFIFGEGSGIARGGKWYNCPRQQSQMCSKANILNEKSDFLCSKVFKLLNQTKGNSINYCV